MYASARGGIGQIYIKFSPTFLVFIFVFTKIQSGGKSEFEILGPNSESVGKSDEILATENFVSIERMFVNGIFPMIPLKSLIKIQNQNEKLM